MSANELPAGLVGAGVAPTIQDQRVAALPRHRVPDPGAPIPDQVRDQMRLWRPALEYIADQHDRDVYHMGTPSEARRTLRVLAIASRELRPYYDLLARLDGAIHDAAAQISVQVGACRHPELLAGALARLQQAGSPPASWADLRHKLAEAIAEEHDVLFPPFAPDNPSEIKLIE